MAVNSNSMNEAAVTFCYEVDVARGGVQTIKRLPWAFARIDSDPGAAPVIVPAGALGLALPGNGLLPQPALYMRDKPFPHDLDRPNTAVGDLAIPGPLAVHFFGGV